MLSGSPYVCPDLGPTTFANHFGPRASKNHFYLQRRQSHPNHVYSGRFESICPLRLRHAQTIESRAPNEHNYPTNKMRERELRSRGTPKETSPDRTGKNETGGKLGVNRRGAGRFRYEKRLRIARESSHAPTLPHRSGIALTTIETRDGRDASMKYLCYELVDPSPVR